MRINDWRKLTNGIIYQSSSQESQDQAAEQILLVHPSRRRNKNLRVKPKEKWEKSSLDLFKGEDQNEMVATPKNYRL